MCHVLIATPIDTDRQFIKKIIRRDFFNISLLPDAYTTEDVLNSADSHVIDLLILDISGAMADAFECKTQVIKKFPNIKTILIDQVQDYQHLHKSLRCAAIDYLVSPLDEVECQQAIHRSILSLNQISLLYVETDKKITDNKSEQTKQMIQYIHVNYQEAISLDTLAAFTHLHRNYVSRLFKEASGMTFTEYLNQYRVEQAKRLLSTTQHSIAQIAESVGYLDPAYFSRLFKKITGLTPNQFRQDYPGVYTPGDIAFALS